MVRSPALEIADVGEQVAELKVFEGASSGLLSDDDLEEAGAALEPGLGRRGSRVRESLGGPVRRRRAPLWRPARRQRADSIQAILAALDASEDAESATATS